MLVKYFYLVFPVTIGGKKKKKKRERRRRFGLYPTKKKKKKIWVIPDPEKEENLGYTRPRRR
jgi:hypothetical protein